MKKILLLVLLLFVFVGCSPSPEPIDGKSFYEWRTSELEIFEAHYYYKKEGNILNRNYTYKGDDEIIPCSVEDYIEYYLTTDKYDYLVNYDSGWWHYHVFVQDYKGDWYSITMQSKTKNITVSQYSQNY